ncbi:hypothetical protein DFH27DRAFT_233036 [Peziza echinospora]|nr:hypothetical protein DFH27DRAFT_233036 [Peziza echinospora]
MDDINIGQEEQSPQAEPEFNPGIVQTTIIYSKYHACSTKFKNLSDLLNTNAKTNPEENANLALSLRDQIGRFRVWAGTAGAHRLGRVSLDHKLREASHVRERVVSLLDELLELLTDVNPDTPHAASTLLSSSVWDSDSDSDPGESSLGSPEEASDLTLTICDIAHVITCLCQLSVLIRQTNPKDRIHKYAAIPMSHFQPYDRAHAQTKHPSAPEYLAQRLGDANTQRRQFFEYRRLHHEKIAKFVDDMMVNEAHGQAGGEAELEEEAHTVITKAQTMTTISTVPGQIELPVEFRAADFESVSGETTTSIGSMYMAENQGASGFLQIPRPPNADFVFEGNPFMCPYCYCIIAVRNTRAWWQHVFKDLRPYVCTFQSCNRPNHLFSTRHEWFEHEVQQHRREWFCAKCNEAFPSKTDFTSHLQESHAEVRSDAEYVSMLASRCERGFAAHALQPCALCGEELSSIKLRQHLGQHLQQLAIWTLPALGELENEEGKYGTEAEDESGSEDSAEISLSGLLNIDSQVSATNEGNEMVGGNDGLEFSDV